MRLHEIDPNVSTGQFLRANTTLARLAAQRAEAGEEEAIEEEVPA